MSDFFFAGIWVSLFSAADFDIATGPAEAVRHLLRLQSHPNNVHRELDKDQGVLSKT